MKAKGRTFREIGLAIDKSRKAVLEKFKRGRESEGKSHISFEGHRVPVPPEVMRAKEDRAAAQGRRTLTQSLLGDPPPGYSALDRTNRSQEVADR